ncbi:MAG: transcriptional repressor LexA [Christensenellaceae bacterium]|jgi:repressor LexA|nr:transcriptional repressor LexA [Christensenellaceae bacterium]
MQNLSKSQRAIYDYIREYIGTHAFPPTVREICAAVGLNSTSTVHRHLKSLAQQGFIQLNPSMQRSITLCAHDGEPLPRAAHWAQSGGGQSQFSRVAEPPFISEQPAETPYPAYAQLRRLPIVGYVAAGQPILAVDSIQSYLSLPAQLVHGADETTAFILRVAGESMVDAGMRDGDMIVVHRALKAESGDIVVARVADENVTVKRLFFEKERIRLQPENQSMEPIYASYEDVTIVGKVVTLLRRY